jgi:hypothetical protein
MTRLSILALTAAILVIATTAKTGSPRFKRYQCATAGTLLTMALPVSGSAFNTWFRRPDLEKTPNGISGCKQRTRKS